MFDSIINGNIDLISFIIILISSLLLGLLIAFVHMKGGKSSKNFFITLTVLPLLVASIILTTNGSLGTAVAIMGSFSLIRFRSIPGTSKEITSVFFSMVIGVVLGTGYILVAFLLTIFISLVITLLNKVKIGEKTKELKVVVPEDLDYTDMFEEIFNKYTSKHELIKSSTTNMGSMFELKYEIILKEGTNEKEFIDEIRVRNGNLRVTLSNYIEESL